MHANTSASRAALVLALCGALSALAGCGSSTQSRPARTQTAAAGHVKGTGTIVFRRFFDSSHDTGAIFLIGSGGGGGRQLSHPPAGAVDSLNGPPSFAPDGSTFIFDRTDANGNGSLWSVRADGSNEHRIRSLTGLPG